MRFLELWDPIIDKSAIESQVILEEKDWELDRFKKFKEEAEAEIDGDEEPLVYERWDAEFASVAYKQQVEALAQSQLPKDMECAMEAAEAAYVYCEPSRKEIDFKPKSKNKTKKKKFRSLKKGALASQPEAAHDEPSLEIIPIDYDDGNSDMFECSDYVTSPSPFQRKRKKAQGTLEDDKKFSKKKKKDHSQSSQFILDKLHGEGKVSKGSDNMVMDLDHKLISRNKMGGKISISVMPAKRILVIKPEKLNKKGSIWLRGCSASPDLWSSQEDVILCAIVHEYGTNWSLVSDMLYGMTAGGSYRGRFHHPVNCCERFRELFQRYVLFMTENPTNEKFGNTGPGKAIFRATEDSIRTLLDVASDLPDNELLLQKHLTAVISSVWRSRSRVGCWQGMTAPFGNHAFRKIMPGKQWNFSFAGLRQSSKLVGAALHDANTKQQDAIFPPSQMIEAVAEVEKLDVTLEFHTGDDYSEIPLPSSINLTICGPDQSSSADESNGGGPLLDPLSNTAEKRFRVAPNTCFDGKSSGWALSAFSSGDFVQIRSTLKQQYLGKNNTPLSDSIRSAESSFSRISNELLEEQHPIYNVTFSSPEPLAATDPVVSFDSFVVTDDAHSIGHDEYPTCDRTNESIVPDSNVFEAVPHHYDPDIISGLDDCTNLPDFTDMG